MDAQPVTHTATDRHLCRFPSGRSLSATVHRYEGGPGPTVYVQATQHGIELNGPAALRRLHGRLADADLAGTVVAVPLVNPPAFDHRSYTAPADYDALNANLNLNGPGATEGSLHERIAARLWDLVTDLDPAAAVDLHTGTAEMLRHVRFTEGDDRARALAVAFGVEHLLADPAADPDPNADADANADSERARDTFRAAATAAGVPTLTAELSNSRTVAPAAARAGAEGVRNVLRALDALPEAAPTADRTVLRDDRAETTADVSGLFELQPEVGTGDHLEAGAELGRIHDPASFDHLSTVTVEESGVAYSLTREAVVFAGERLGAVGSRPE